MTSFGPQIIAALIVGLVLGLIAKYTGSTAEEPNGLGRFLSIIGSSYVSLLRTAVIPIFFRSSGVYRQPFQGHQRRTFGMADPTVVRNYRTGLRNHRHAPA